MTTEFDISFEWRRGIFARFRQHDGKHIETMPVPDEFVRWREGKTSELESNRIAVKLQGSRYKDAS